MQSEVEKWRAWKREHPDFPLTAHPRGQWVKSVRGKLRYFGPLRDPGAAAELWATEKDYLLAGMEPPTYKAGMTVAGLLEAHAEDVRERVSAGRLSENTQRGYAVLPRFFRAASLLETPVDSLGPVHFARLQRAIEHSGQRLSTQKHIIVAIRTILNWGRKMGIVNGVEYGPRFVAPSTTAIEAERDNSGTSRFLDRGLILGALDRAGPQLRVVILLGINCGFYPGDAAAIPLDRLHLDGPIPYHDFRRAKTGSRRMAALWPETVSAIEHYRDNCRRPVDPSERRLLLTRNGRAYTRISGPNQLADKFSRVAGGLPRGVSIGSLRHTYATVVDTVPDQAMIDLTMGHTSKSLQRRVYRQLNLNELQRLEGVATTVRRWLYGQGTHE